jgi:type IV secretion system protein VirB6
MGIFTDLNNEIDELTKTFTTDVMQNIATNITPIVIAGLTLWIVVFGLLIINQKIEKSMQSFVMECSKIGIITGIALTGGIYQTELVNIVISLPEDFAKLAFQNPSDTFSVADHILAIGVDKAYEIMSSGSGWHPIDSVIKLAVGLSIALSSVALGGLGGLFLIIIKAQITIFASIGPLVIVALLFPMIRAWFSNWLSEIMSVCFFSLFLTVIFVFILKIAEKFISAIVEGENMLLAASSYMILTVLAGLLFFEAKSFSARIAGVLSIGILGTASDAGKQAIGNRLGELKQSAQNAAKSAPNLAGRAVGKYGNWRKKK